MLGNVLRSGEDRAGGRYGLASMTAYPRIYPHLSAKLDAAMSRQLDLIATTSALCVSFFIAGVATLPVLLHHLEWAAVPLAAFVLAALSYSAAVRAAAGHGPLFAAAFDLHRFDMLRALHYDLPRTPSDEVDLNEALSEFWQGQERVDRSRRIKYREYNHQAPASPTADNSGGTN
jgi:hypothetical protein